MSLRARAGRLPTLLAVLAALFVLWLYEPDTRRLPPAKRPAPAAGDPNWHTTVVRAR